jgi:Cu-processing system permease protein
MLFSQPIGRGDVLVGKLLGLFAAITTATVAGFGAGGVVISLRTEIDNIGAYFFFVGLSLLLALVFLSISALVSILNHRQTRSFGIALTVWFFFVILFDLLAMGGSLLLREKTANYFIFGSLFANPVGMVRVAGLIALNGEEVFGAAGASLLKFTGGAISGLAALLAALAVWIVAPLAASIRLFRKQDI